MDSPAALPASRTAPQRQLSKLRRHQRRLLFGSGGVLSILILLTALASGYSGIVDFHAQQWQVFHDGQTSVDYFLAQRDRAYASSMNANDALWTMQRPMLASTGAPLAHAFIEHGEQLLVRAEGKLAVPWLVLGQGAATMPREELAAYMGMLQEYSAYTAASISAIDSKEPVFVYAYEPSGKLLAVTGVRDETELLQKLKVSSRDQAFTVLREGEERLRGAKPASGPIASSAAAGRLVSYYDKNPLTGQPALVDLLTLTVGDQPYFRRVVFESIENIKARLMSAVPQAAFAAIDSEGAQVFVCGPMPLKARATLASLRPSAKKLPERQYADGIFMLAEPLQGVDWTLVHFYTWGDVLAQEGPQLSTIAGIALISLALLWAMLVRLDRQVFGPALADASRVYESEALSRVIIDTAPVGLCLLDPDSGAPMVENEVARSMAGKGQDAMPAPLYAQLVKRAATHGAASLHEFQWTEGDGDQRRYLQVAMALSMYRMRPAWVCALRDVTTQAQLEENLRRARHDSEQARQAAESASRAKSAFVATMSHEIRTPLNGVLGHLELLSRSKLDPSQRERLDRIRLSADSLLAIISDVLDFSKIEAGQLDITSAPFALRPLVEQATLLYSPTAQRKGVRLFYAIDPALAASYVSDVHRLRQIINNLLSNATKFTESGRIVLRVSQGEPSKKRPLWLRFQVVDSGIGMNEQQLGQLFDAFSQADSSISRRYGGTGLGLALCRQLAQLLGGEIRAESTQGVGSVFTLDVPVEAAPPERSLSGPLAGQRITLLSFAAEWRQEIGALLASWGAEANVIAQPSECPPGQEYDVLLIFGEPRSWSQEEEGVLIAGHARVVRAYQNGPLIPEQRTDAIYVSCYASQALLGAIRQKSATPAAAEAAPAATRAERGRLLLVEDNPVNRELIQQQLQELGFAVDAAEDGEQALLSYKPDVHHAVLTDINMPGMSGYELARALRERGAKQPILAITATALASERTRCKAAGIDDLLLKPLTLDALDGMLNRYVSIKNLAATAAPAAEPEPARPRLPEKLRRIFIDTGRRDIKRLADAAASNDVQGVIDLAHAFKGALLMIGEREAGQLCSTLELRLHEGEALVLEEEVSRLIDQLDAVVRRYEAQVG
ncbi:hybrid sensor histidine kinase/response regulator [Dyella sp.]|uniref:hybrid sensor histidine kinase/response regulator n=1 Tax=Dyella sp. TaxID=1869338 RepID=UPI002D788F0F|nr:ATP-binding protein [Dyella sp.]HET7331788.1 ATP-binding protein [Dyella sp.]